MKDIFTFVHIFKPLLVFKKKCVCRELSNCEWRRMKVSLPPVYTGGVELESLAYETFITIFVIKEAGILVVITNPS